MPTKKNIYSLLFTLIGIVTFAQQIQTTNTNQFSFDNSLLVINSGSNKLENDKTNRYTFDKEDSFKLDSSFHINDSLVYPPTTKDYRKLGYNSAIVFGTTIVAYGI
jgi:hypothetical protein